MGKKILLCFIFCVVAIFGLKIFINQSSVVDKKTVDKDQTHANENVDDTKGEPFVLNNIVLDCPSKYSFNKLDTGCVVSDGINIAVVKSIVLPKKVNNYNEEYFASYVYSDAIKEYSEVFNCFSYKFKRENITAVINKNNVSLKYMPISLYFSGDILIMDTYLYYYDTPSGCCLSYIICNYSSNKFGNYRELQQLLINSIN